MAERPNCLQTYGTKMGGVPPVLPIGAILAPLTKFLDSQIEIVKGNRKGVWSRTARESASKKESRQ